MEECGCECEREDEDEGEDEVSLLSSEMLLPAESRANMVGR